MANKVQMWRSIFMLLVYIPQRHVGEWSVTCPGCFHPGERALSIHWLVHRVDPSQIPETAMKRKISCPCQELNSSFPVIYPVVYKLFQLCCPSCFKHTNEQTDNIPQDGTHWWHQQLLCQFVCIQRQGQSRRASFHVHVLTQAPDGGSKQSVWHRHGSMEATQHHLLGLHFDELRSQTLKSTSIYSNVWISLHTI